MKRFTFAGRSALAANNLYAGLTLALIVPDICGSLETPDTGNRERYVRWCKRWLEPRFNPGSWAGITADDFFQIRCSVIHSGRSDVPKKKKATLSSFQFSDKSATEGILIMKKCMVNGIELPDFIQIRADRFAETIFAAAEEWDTWSENEAEILLRKAGLLNIQGQGGSLFGAMRIGSQGFLL